MTATSAALERLRLYIEYDGGALPTADARTILAHIADLEARAEWAEAFGHVFHTLPDGRLDFVAVREGSELGKLHQRAGAAEARAEKLRQERDDFADMVGAELCHQPGTVTAEWDAAKRRAEALTAEVTRLRAALEDKIARMAWDRFAPEHETDFDECAHKAEYLRFAADALAKAALLEPGPADGHRLYESAVQGRRDFRAAYRRERERAGQLEALLREARDRVPDWTTGVNADLIARIDAALEGSHD